MTTTSEGGSPARIGLALSGGGYRAAAFHLGTLDALEAVGWLPRVRALSTISGGTLVGCAYARAQSHADFTFSAFFQRFHAFLDTTHVIEEALAQPERRQTPSGRPSLITAAAAVYAARLTDTARLGELVGEYGHLDDVCFSATEFRTGWAFRFQRSRLSQPIVGNSAFRVPEKLAARTRLADIIAASSCFPGGFEPLAFPDDFVWSGGDGNASSEAPELPPTFPAALPLMDGGIHDNQGLDSLLLASRRVGSGLDLLIASDTDQGVKDEVFVMPPPPDGSAPSLAAVACGVAAALLLLLVGGGALAVERFNQLREGGFSATHLLSLLPMLVSLGLPIFALVAVQRLLEAVKQSYPGRDPALLWSFLGRMPADTALHLTTLRVRSTAAMAMSVFMRRIRSMGYRQHFLDGTSKLPLVSNLIYDLEKAPNDALAPTDAQRALAAKARLVPTTLWFTEEGQLRELIACGHNTLVYNLLQHTEGKDEALRARWEALKENPFALLERHTKTASVRLTQAA